VFWNLLKNPVSIPARGRKRQLDNDVKICPGVAFVKSRWVDLRNIDVHKDHVIVVDHISVISMLLSETARCWFVIVRTSISPFHPS